MAGADLEASSAGDTAAMPRLGCVGLTKRFGGTLAVSDVSFDVKPGEIVALLGQNGAGKSTVIKMLAGVYKLDSGEMLMNGPARSAQRQALHLLHPPGSRPHRVDDRGREHRARAGLSPPLRPGRLARGRSMAAPLARHGRPTTSTRAAASAISPARRSRSSPSPGRSASRRECWCWTSPPPACRSRRGRAPVPRAAPAARRTA